MAHFTKQEIEEIRQRLATLAVKDSQFPSATAVYLEDFVAIVQEGINKKVTIGDLYKNAGGIFFENYVFLLNVYAKNGSMILRNGSSSVDLEAEVVLGTKNITSLIPINYFSWQRSSGDEYYDNLWNRLHVGAGSIIHITQNDVNNKGCTFYCCIPIESLLDLNIEI